MDKTPATRFLAQVSADELHRWLRCALILVTATLFFFFQLPYHFFRGPGRIAPDFQHLASHCATIPPIAAAEFHHRQKVLAERLYSIGARAYIAEPGPNANYYANISTQVWHPSERPFLLVIKPSITEDGDIQANIIIVTPQFEASRAALLVIPSTQNVSFVSWAEEENPYHVVRSLLDHTDSASKLDLIFDENARLFIVNGLQSVAPTWAIQASPHVVRQIRERKSAAEVRIMRCANEVTLMAIRAVRDQMYIGIRESEGRALIKQALAEGGLSDGSALVLFGENAALPHGSGSDRVLGRQDFALFDVGGFLHGYVSDITRTFALPESKIPTSSLETWFIVRTAQQAAHKHAREGVAASSIDAAGRMIIKAAGNGAHFTHRLGHGIGLEGHEAPYLVGSDSTLLAPGNAFSNEPGIYIPGKVGVRLEDIFIIGEDGLPEFLTSGAGGTARTPWDF